jgi:hypothetical protein
MAVKANLQIDQRSDFSKVFNLTRLKLPSSNTSVYTYTGQLRKEYTSANGYSFSFSVVSNTEISMTMSKDITSLLNGRYVYDVFGQTSTSKIRLVEGLVTVTPAVTQ